MNKHQSYKSSGVEWIGEIPENWEVRRIKFLFKSIVEKSIDGSEELLSVSEKKGIVPRRELRDENEELTRSESLEGYLKVQKDDLVNNIMLMWKRGLGFSNYNGIVSPSYSVFRLNKPNIPSFWNYLLRTDLYITEYRRNSTGVIDSRLRLYDDSFGDIFSILPPLQEQLQIVQYLDEKTELIDKLISTKERKITILKQQRTSVINQVVTKGLNPNVKMKDSGVEWIGEIPEHWKISKLGFYTTKIGSGSTPKGGSEIYPDSGIPFIRSQNVHFNGLRLNDVSFIDFETHKSMKGSKVIKNDVLLNITGGSIGRCCIVEIEGEMNVNQHVSIIRTTLELVNYFLNYILNSDLGQSQVLFNLTGGNREGLTIEGIRNFRITIPPINEQIQIIEHLDSKTKEIDDLVYLEQKKIDLLKEYRQSLISEVVTGKIKVTN